MVVSIKFHGMQRVVTNTDSIDMPITEKTTVNDALEYVRQLYPSLHLEEGTIVVAVNLEIASLDRILRDNDTVSFLPNIAGG
ncbi:MAG: MoaD/ThiS family protein [Chloroflexi bacterium]|nr:MoaD/ThiS family protein [Chloroflexota bacterium]MBL7061872.1 MoaD/ThiS family protein [Dehalococcoidia bacterium]